MCLFFYEYYLIFLFFSFSFSIAIFVLFLSYIFSYENSYSEKLSAYECGFDPFEDARNQFDVRFYLVAILFLVFDIEASFLFPWAVTLSNQGSFSFWAIIDFFIELVVGFLYAWRVGALEWLIMRSRVIGLSRKVHNLKIIGSSPISASALYEEHYYFFIL